MSTTPVDESKRVADARFDKGVALRRRDAEKAHDERLAKFKIAQGRLGMDDKVFGEFLRSLARHGAPRTLEELCLLDGRRVYDFFTICINLAGRPPTPPDLMVRPRRRPAADRAVLISQLCGTLTLLTRASGDAYTLEVADTVCIEMGWCERIEFATPAVLRMVLQLFHETLCTVAGKWPPPNAMPPWGSGFEGSDR